jgi:Tfp pilus assembly protein PilF
MNHRSGLTQFPFTLYLALAMCASLATAQAPTSPISATNDDFQHRSTANVPLQAEGTRYLIQQKKWKEASASLQTALQRNPGDVDSMYWSGVVSLQLHDYIGATRALRSAQKAGMRSAALHVELGHAYYGLHQYFLFEEQMRTALEIEPTNLDAKYSMALYRLHVLSDVSGALALFRESALLQPDDWRSSYQVGYCLELSAKSTEAREVYLRDVDLLEKKHESFGWPYQGLARVLMEEDPQQAAVYAKLAVDREPEEYSNHLTLAKVYEKLGDLKNAAAEGRIAVDQNPTDASARYFLFMLYRRSGDLASADQEMAAFKRLRAAYGSE